MRVNFPKLRKLSIKRSNRQLEIMREIINFCAQSLESITLARLPVYFITRYLDSIIASGVKLKELHMKRMDIRTEDIRRLG